MTGVTLGFEATYSPYLVGNFGDSSWHAFLQTHSLDSTDESNSHSASYPLYCTDSALLISLRCNDAPVGKFSLYSTYLPILKFHKVSPSLRRCKHFPFLKQSRIFSKIDMAHHVPSTSAPSQSSDIPTLQQSHYPCQSLKFSKPSIITRQCSFSTLTRTVHEKMPKRSNHKLLYNCH